MCDKLKCGDRLKNGQCGLYLKRRKGIIIGCTGEKDRKPDLIMDVTLATSEWLAVMDILSLSKDKRAGIIYQKVGTQVVL